MASSHSVIRHDNPRSCLAADRIGGHSFHDPGRVAPGRELPNAPGWYARAVIVTLFQVGITLATSKLWTHVFSRASLFDLDALQRPALEGFIGWLVGTFFFYWWHRIRHMNGWWVLFH